VGGDCLEITVCAQPRTSALFTTPAAQKLYRSAGRKSRQQLRLSLGEGSALEWLPTETIVFDGALGSLDTRVSIGPGAAFMGWEIVCLGRPAAAEKFERGTLELGFRITRGDELALIERARIDGGCTVLDQAFGYGGRSVFGNLYCVPRDQRQASALVDLLRSTPGLGQRVAVTALDGMLVLRCFADTCEQARSSLVRAWQALRPEVLGRAACAPRLWAT
jgi:urease accessory protein